MPKAVIENTEVYQLKSDIVGDTFEITVMKPEEVPDWFKVRGYGYTMQRLTDIPKGALVEVNGMLTQQTSQKGEHYVEIKSRKIKVHSKSKAGGNSDSASGTSAAGYDHEAFTGESEMPDNWN